MMVSIHIQSRRLFVAGILASLTSAGFAQSAGSAFVGTWKGDVPGVGEATLIVTSIGAGGRVEGRMEFALQGFVSTFGDKADSIKRTNQGSVADGTLTIEAALGGTLRAPAQWRDAEWPLHARHDHGCPGDIQEVMMKR